MLGMCPAMNRTLLIYKLSDNQEVSSLKLFIITLNEMRDYIPLFSISAEVERTDCLSMGVNIVG